MAQILVKQRHDNDLSKPSIYTICSLEDRSKTLNPHIRVSTSSLTSEENGRHVNTVYSARLAHFFPPAH